MPVIVVGLTTAYALALLCAGHGAAVAIEEHDPPPPPAAYTLVDEVAQLPLTHDRDFARSMPRCQAAEKFARRGADKISCACHTFRRARDRLRHELRVRPALHTYQSSPPARERRGARVIHTNLLTR